MSSFRRAQLFGTVGAMLVAGGLASGCSDIRPLEEERRHCVSWVEEIQELLAPCAECHGDMPEGSYSTASYLDVLGDGSDDVANAIAGDAGSLILDAVSDATHFGVLDADQIAQLREWVVDCELSYFRSGLHAGGILNPDDSDFHGELLRANDWSFELCATCHGEDFSGGKAEAPCLTCHTDGPTACNVCHGSAAGPAPPRALDSSTDTTALGVGAHQPHLLGGPLDKPVACEECHTVPTAWDDIGHIFVAEDEVDPDPNAEVIFGARAGDDAVWDRDAATCTVYCHGGTWTDAAATNNEPHWTEVGTGQAACGTCHGLPPSSHANDKCEQCHFLVVDDAQAIIDLERHFDGTVDVGDGSGTCFQCHGDSSSPAPPKDLDGNIAITAVGVGAHRGHLNAGTFSGPIPCEECHQVPTDILSAGHIDSDTPAEVIFGTLATADSATPVWDRVAATCDGVYCHGGGSRLAGDLWPSLNPTPDWTGGAGETGCGTCHGLPPDNGTHAGGLTLTDCVNCHNQTVTATGQIIIAGGKHINGVADVP